MNATRSAAVVVFGLSTVGFAVIADADPSDWGLAQLVVAAGSFFMGIAGRSWSLAVLLPFAVLVAIPFELSALPSDGGGDSQPVVLLALLALPVTLFAFAAGTWAGRRREGPRSSPDRQM